MDNPASTIYVAKVSKTHDPAINDDHPDVFGLVAKYARSRTREDLAALPLKPGAALRRFSLRALTGDEHAYAVSAQSEFDQQRRAFMLAVHEIVHPDGTAEPAKAVRTGDLLLAPSSWYDRCYKLGGASLIRELGGLAIQRAELGEDSAGPFVLSRGCAL
jgi:hypothetical protein